MNGVCNVTIVLVHPLEPWGGAKSSNIIDFVISITKSISRVFIPTLCVFSQMKDIKHIRWDFHSVAWVMPQSLRLGGAGGSKI